METDISERKSLFPEEALKYGLVQEIKTDLLPQEADLIPIYESEAFPPNQNQPQGLLHKEPAAISEPDNSYSI